MGARAHSLAFSDRRRPDPRPKPDASPDPPQTPRGAPSLTRSRGFMRARCALDEQDRTAARCGRTPDRLPGPGWDRRSTGTNRARGDARHAFAPRAPRRTIGRTLPRQSTPHSGQSPAKSVAVAALGTRESTASCAPGDREGSSRTRVASQLHNAFYPWSRVRRLREHTSLATASLRRLATPNGPCLYHPMSEDLRQCALPMGARLREAKPSLIPVAAVGSPASVETYRPALPKMRGATARARRRSPGRS